MSHLCIKCKKITGSFNHIGQNRNNYCKNCKGPEMVDVKHPKCIICKNKEPYFGIYGDKKATHCKKCKEPEMVDVKNPKCIICKNKQPNFNLYGEKKATHCKKCKEPEMVDIKNPKCIICKNKRPYFGLKEGTPTHCFICKLPQHNNVVSKKCDSCKKIIATFGIKKATHCFTCKTDEMKDIKNTMCLICKKTQPSFNYPTEISVRYCLSCKLPGMIDIRNIKCDICKTVMATYGIEGTKNPTRCKTHRDPEMIDVKHRSCKTPMCNTRVTDKYQGYCMRCYIYQFPEAEITKNYRIKEKHVTDYIAKSFPEIFITFNKQINGGCSKRRPDIFIGLSTHSIIIEIDEEQHKKYDDLCEKVRINELYTDLGDRPLILIRFNPDAYIKDGKKMPSSFKTHRSLDVPIIANEEEWSMRIDLLTETIEKYINNIPQEKDQLTIEYLFFNEILN